MKLRETLETLFIEMFEGTALGADGTWVVQGGEALEDTLSKVNADQASVQISPQSSSIAAHVVHMTHYLQLSNAQAREEAFEADWAGSWQKQVVDEIEWTEIKGQLGIQKGLLQDLMKNPNIGDIDEAVSGAIANIAHAAYHLGAIRQIFVIVTSPNPQG